MAALRTSSALLVCLDCWTAYSKRRTLLTQISANYAPTKTLQNVFDSTAGGATHHGSPDSTCKCNGWFRVGLF
ncbi:hypothetical protein GBL12_10180 [Bifidobacterium longum]|nr:hypothetical protein GBL12_10180 [Bifidobacterium longum]